MKKTIFFGFICAVLFIACSSDDEDSITRNPQKITYAQGTHVYEISNDVGTLTLENFPASKTLFLAKTNPTETIVPMANTHYIASGTNVSLNSTGVYSRSAEAAADSSAQSQEHSRTCYSMHLAEIAHISTVPHALIRFNDGELNYITRRVDRMSDGKKLAMEDMCQLAERQTEQKYQGSYELVASLITRYSSMPKLDLVNYWEQVLFSWVVGNADMHLKNFSLISERPGLYRLSPTYDQVSTAIVMPEDTEELAMTVQGFKKKLMNFDFRYAMESTGVEEKTAQRILSRFDRFKEEWFACIDSSFVTDEQKTMFKELITERLERLKK